MEILTARNLTFTYPKCSEPALKGLSFTVQKGDLTVLCGSTGSGKSTLMSLLKREIAPAGKRSGEILIHGVSVDALSERDSAIAVGYVSQHPEEQIVTDKVWHELAFGLENLGLPNALIRRRVAETASYFGIERWFEQSTGELSGGQKQILNLASVMVMRPEILLLDEPTSQLDPIAASEFISTVAALNRDLGLTVLISEHRLEELLPLSRKTMALRNGEMYAYGETRAVVEKLSRDPLYSEYLPAATRLYGLLPTSASEPPLTVAEGRTLIETVLNEPFDAANPKNSTVSTPLREAIDSATPSFNTYSTVTANAAVSTVSTSSRESFDAANPENSTVSTPLREDIDSATPSFNTYSTVTSNAAVPTVSTSSREPFDAANPRNSTVFTPSGTTDIQPQRDTQKNNIALEFSNVYFRYSRDTGDVLRGLDFKVRENEIYFILGGNGSGKSTALSNAAGILKPYSGRIKIFDTLIKKLTPEKLHGEYVAMLPQNVKTLFMFNTVREELEDSGTDGAELGYDFSPLLSRHPYDLSGGQQQLVALAKVLAGKPKILLLDEPTKGLDAYTKAELSRLIFRLRERGMTVIAVTHDAEFAAATADRCALFFRGEIVSEEAPRRFFSLNTFYTTAAARMASGLLPDIATVADIAEALKK